MSTATERDAFEASPRFDKTYCSQCGGEFGPGNEGYSHCADHRAARASALLPQDGVEPVLWQWRRFVPEMGDTEWTPWREVLAGDLGYWQERARGPGYEVRALCAAPASSPVAPQAEPVAWRWQEKHPFNNEPVWHFAAHHSPDVGSAEPLFAAPQGDGLLRQALEAGEKQMLMYAAYLAAQSNEGQYLGINTGIGSQRAYEIAEDIRRFCKHVAALRQYLPKD